MARYYEWIKAFHVIMVICWMAGMFYLPRLFVYHTGCTVGSDQDKLFQIMERKLSKIIIMPAMILTIILGLMLCHIYGWHNLTIWFHIKATAILILVIFHGLFSKWRKDFVLGKNIRSEKFYRCINEIPPLMMIIAVIMVIIKPFD